MVEKKRKSDLGDLKVHVGNLCRAAGGGRVSCLILARASDVEDSSSTVGK